MQHRAYKYRLYPTKEQEIFLARNFGAVRFIWNQLVANFNNYGTDSYKNNLSETNIKESHPWLNECISYAIQQKRIDFSNTTKQYFNKKRKLKISRPSFKKKGVSVDSFRLTGQCLGDKKAFNFELGTVKIPKLKKPIKVKFDRIFTGRVLSATISKNSCNEYYISVCVQEEIQQLPKTNQNIGIDLGINDLLILSDGTKFQNPKLFRETQAKLKKAQQQL